MSKKNPAFLKEENLLTLLSQNNFIVPEIQREYVWGDNEKVIVNFLKDLKNKIGVCCPDCYSPVSEAKINIGFLYSYKPDYVKIEHERFLDENLIDGQQRFTTLFLLLFCCALKENRKEEFKSLIRFEGKIRMCFDFRVRDLTKRFLLELVEKVNNIEQLGLITQQTWFLKDYQFDVSIKSMCKALDYIQTIFSNKTKYYNYLINYVVFWHFKTEATSQGEELYITMNARGEEMADHEVTKALLMVDDSRLYEWGTKWEEWQQFFWKNRDKKDKIQSADKGFNGFLSCIAGLESYLTYRDWETAEKDVQKLSFDKVNEYYNAFKYLMDSKSKFCEKYRYSDWVNICLAEIWKIFNNNNTEWMANYKDPNEGNAVSRMVFIWSILHYLNTRENSRGEVEAFRVLRLFYVRYNNYSRAIAGLTENIRRINQDGPWTAPCGPEEYLKHSLLNNVNCEEVNNFEEIIWEIEDHPLNIDGSEVGNINITHLINLESQPSLDELKKTKDAFNKLFPNGSKKGDELLKTILLFFGDFWKDWSYNGVKRYDFSDWKRNIRKKGFENLITDLTIKQPEQCLQDLRKKFLIDNKDEIINSHFVLSGGKLLRIKLIYYSLFLTPDELWQKGEVIIIYNDVTSSRLFADEDQIIYNIKQDFRGSGVDLWEIVTRKYDNPLEELKTKVLL